MIFAVYFFIAFLVFMCFDGSDYEPHEAACLAIVWPLFALVTFYRWMKK